MLEITQNSETSIAADSPDFLEGFELGRTYRPHFRKRKNKHGYAFHVVIALRGRYLKRKNGGKSWAKILANRRKKGRKDLAA